jgi:ParB-like chromosome segregation protein Spo0J
MLRIDNLDPKTLRANPWNTNHVSPDNERKLEESIRRFGFFKPILAREVGGQLEVIGGEHRWQAALSLGETTVPVVNLGAIDDQKAKEISLVDNGRYGQDDTLQLANLLEELGDTAELVEFMPYDNAELESIFSSVSIALDDLELTDEDEKPPVLPTSKPVQQFQVMRFKVPMEDAEMVAKRMEAIMKQQKFTEDDSLTNAGLALVHLCQEN